MRTAIHLLAVLLPMTSIADTPGSRTFYLQHVPASGLGELLERLVREGSPWAEPLQPHWQLLRESVEIRADQNALRATGSPEAIGALAQVIAALDVPRAAVKLSYLQLHVSDPAALCGRPVGPPVPGGVGAAPVEARVAVGDWRRRAEALIEAGAATPLVRGETEALDGLSDVVYVGEAEAEPDFLLQFRPVALESGEMWLSVGFGQVARKGLDSTGREADEPLDRPAYQCVSCGPGLGDVWLRPELEVTALVGKGQSLLIGGLDWYAEEDGSPVGPGNEFLVLTAEVIASPAEPPG